jgi:hypothetical protein
MRSEVAGGMFPQGPWRQRKNDHQGALLEIKHPVVALAHDPHPDTLVEPQSPCFVFCVDTEAHSSKASGV